MTTDQEVRNFGGNVSFRPSLVVAPRTEAELLAALDEHRGRRVRAVGRLHSWSETVVCPEVLIDLRHFDSVAVSTDDDGAWADVGAGCQIKRLLDELARQGDYTTRSLGLITEQSIAGATATGTHGSGRHCLSHYVAAVRVATYDPASGRAMMRTIEGGRELAAARCSLGALGIVTSVRLPIRRQYQVEEHFRRYDRLEEVLAAEREFELQQFYFVPWRWDFFAQHRREVDAPRSRLAPLYRLYWSAGMDVGLHWVVIALARWLPRFCTKLFFRRLMPALVPRGWRVVDRSDRQLTMEHELFRHIEIEMFVTRSRLAHTLEFVEWYLRHCGGEAIEPTAELARRLAAAGVRERLDELRGSYFQHYPICIRKVLPDDLTISMASGDEAAYAISFISYVRPERRAGFFRFARGLAHAASRLFDARPHWGKFCPLDECDFDCLYPRLKEFRATVAEFDPQGAFGNPWLDQLLDRRVERA